ncbi:hypothetical protein [Parasphingorhabdus sp.]|uniref:hypothetical protein n=1 Tax=Parasphingorhabdus sp. TaxID=2709688 RepID=UPI003BB15B8B
MARTPVPVKLMISVSALCLFLSACATTTSNVEPVVSSQSETINAGQCQIDDKKAAKTTVMIIQGSGGVEARCTPGMKISSNSLICLYDQEKVTVLGKTGTKVLSGPGCLSVATGKNEAGSLGPARLESFINNKGKSRARTGAARGWAGSTSPSQVDLGEVKVIRGSATALRRYNRKATIPTGTEICLKRKESLTVLRKKGGTLSLQGPGCNVFRRSGEVVNVAGVSGGN